MSDGEFESKGWKEPKFYMDVVQARLDSLADSGITVSLAYGKSPRLGRIWSVTCLSRQSEQFSKPYAAESLFQAVQIAQKECEERGWL